MESPRLGSLK